MNILYITHYSALYGANKSLLYLLKDIKQRYHITPIVLCPDEGELIKELNKLDIEYYIIKHYRWMTDKNNNIISNRVKIVINKLFFYPYIYKILNKFNISLIHSNSSVISIGYYLSKKLKVPHIWHLREFGYEDYNLKYIYNMSYVKRMFESSDKLIAISESINKHYKNLAPKANISTIYNGINNKNYSEIARQDVDIVNFCCVGLINSNKNQIELIEAVNYLIEKNITNFKVNIIGDGEQNYINRIKEYINENKLDNYIKLWGYKDNINEILPNMQIGIITSKNEAFGRVTVEYMMNGLPVIGSETGGTREIIKHNFNGYLYTLGNVKALSEYMYNYITNKELRIKHGEYALYDSCSRFTMEANTDNIYEIYTKLLNYKNIKEKKWN